MIPNMYIFTPGQEGYCNHNVRLSSVNIWNNDDFSESLGVRKLEFGTKDVNDDF